MAVSSGLATYSSPGRAGRSSKASAVVLLFLCMEACCGGGGGGVESAKQLSLVPHKRGSAAEAYWPLRVEAYRRPEIGHCRDAGHRFGSTVLPRGRGDADVDKCQI